MKTRTYSERLNTARSSKKSCKGEVSIGLLVAMLIGLVVIIVVISIFGSKSKLYGRTLSDCESKGGVCVAKSDCSSPSFFSCKEGGKVCCIVDSCEPEFKCKAGCGEGESRVFLKYCPEGKVCCKGGS